MHTYAQKSGFRNLIAWKESKILTIYIYKLTESFPSSERYNLIDQMRRASSSIMANLAEGTAMATKPHQQSYYVRSRGSTVEIDNFAELSFELGYITREEYDHIVDHCARLGYLITKLIKA